MSLSPLSRLGARGAWLLCALACSPLGANAQAPGDAPCPAGRFVQLVAKPEVPEELAREVATDLAAELSQRGLALCTPSQGEAPAAIAHLSLTDRHAVIELDDRTTEKRVARDVRLDRIPENGRALAIAIAIDELLRASWAELTMHKPEPLPPPAPTPAPPPPGEETELVRTARPARRPLRLGAGLGTLHTRGRFHALSLGVTGQAHVARHGWARVSVAPLAGLPQSFEAGRVRSYGVDGTLALGACADLGQLSLCGGPALGLTWLSFRGTPRAAAQGDRESGLWLRAEGQLALSAVLGGPWSMTAAAGLGAALHGLEVSDGRRTLVGTGGLVASGQLALEVAL